MLVFAYGSNMDDAQLKKRCPNAAFVGIAALRGYQLCFPRLSKNRGCGVSSVIRAVGHDVWGVVHRLNNEDLASLDREEGFRSDRPADKNGYNRIPVSVEMNGVPTHVETYIAVATANPPPPTREYLDLIRNGARHHRLPDAYQALLAAL